VGREGEPIRCPILVPVSQSIKGMVVHMVTTRRTTILVLRQQGRSIRAIARAVKVSRDTVDRGLAAVAPAIPENRRLVKARAHQGAIPAPTDRKGGRAARARAA
jgi:hypothetical protein